MLRRSLAAAAATSVERGGPPLLLLLSILRGSLSLSFFFSLGPESKRRLPLSLPQAPRLRCITENVWL